jgi:DNA-binding response OmpR family regulator
MVFSVPGLILGEEASFPGEVPMIGDQRMVLLVVEDEGVLKMLVRLFSSKGFLVKQADDAKAAFSLLSPEVDIVVMDSFSSKEGLELAQLVKAKIKVPVILISGTHFVDRQSIDAVLVKPFLLQDLMHVVNMFLMS